MSHGKGDKRRERTFASLSFARCAYILGCSETFDILVARGKECRDCDTLGKATRPFLLDASREAIEKYKEEEREKERKTKGTGARDGTERDGKKKRGTRFGLNI